MSPWEYSGDGRVDGLPAGRGGSLIAAVVWLWTKEGTARRFRMRCENGVLMYFVAAAICVLRCCCRRIAASEGNRVKWLISEYIAILILI